MNKSLRRERGLENYAPRAAATGVLSKNFDHESLGNTASRLAAWHIGRAIAPVSGDRPDPLGTIRGQRNFLQELPAEDEPEQRERSDGREQNVEHSAGAATKHNYAFHQTGGRDHDTENERHEKQRRGRPRAPAIELSGVDFNCHETGSRDPEQTREAI